MKTTYIFLIGAVCFCSSCESSKPMLVEEARKATTVDVPPKTSATSDERFRNAKPSPVQGEAPKNWLSLPAAQFRELNYRFGASGRGEVYVTLASGSVVDNLNRWRHQFGLAPVQTREEFQSLERITVMDTQGVWVEAKGNYASGMGGSDVKSSYGLAGAISLVNGRIVTVKMVGPEAEVEAEKVALKDFIASLKLVD